MSLVPSGDEGEGVVCVTQMVDVVVHRRTLDAADVTGRCDRVCHAHTPRVTPRFWPCKPDCPTMSSGTTIGVWIGDDDDLIDRFDRRFGTSDPHWSRSQEIKRAMRLHLVVEDTLGDLPWTFSSEQAQRHWLQRVLSLAAEVEREGGDATRRSEWAVREE